MLEKPDGNRHEDGRLQPRGIRGANENSAPGRIRAARLMLSGVRTATTGYPPVTGWSLSITIGSPPGGIWTAPEGIGSDRFRAMLSGKPLEVPAGAILNPMRFDCGETIHRAASRAA